MQHPLVVVVVSALLSGSCIAAEAARERAVLLTQYIQKNYWDQDKKTYRNWFPEKKGELPYGTMWGLGIQFSVLSGAAAYEATPYKLWMERFADGLENYFNKKKKMYSAYLGGTDDIYYDDNHWLILDYVEAYEITRNQAYLKKAQVLLDACLGGVDDVLGGGSYWRIDTKGYPTKNTCANAPLAAALFKIIPHITQVEQKRAYYAQGLKILEWTQNNLQDKDGLLWDNININTKGVDKRKYTYNTALMIQSHLSLYKINKEKKQLDESIRLANASAHWIKESDSKSGPSYSGTLRFTVHLVEALLDVYQITKDKTLLQNCRNTAEASWQKWKPDGQAELIELSSIARIQWLLAAVEKMEPARK
jgi:predicted alpha-1,6-mannanase (GH76 family)